MCNDVTSVTADSVVALHALVEVVVEGMLMVVVVTPTTPLKTTMATQATPIVVGAKANQTTSLFLFTAALAGWPAVSKLTLPLPYTAAAKQLYYTLMDVFSYFFSLFSSSRLLPAHLACLALANATLAGSVGLPGLGLYKTITRLH